MTETPCVSFLGLTRCLADLLLRIAIFGGIRIWLSRTLGSLGGSLGSLGSLGDGWGCFFASFRMSRTKRSISVFLGLSGIARFLSHIPAGFSRMPSTIFVGSYLGSSYASDIVSIWGIWGGMWGGIWFPAFSTSHRVLFLGLLCDNLGRSTYLIGFLGILGTLWTLRILRIPWVPSSICITVGLFLTDLLLIYKYARLFF